MGTGGAWGAMEMDMEILGKEAMVKILTRYLAM